MPAKHKLYTALMLIFFTTYVNAGIAERTCLSELQFKLPDFTLDTARGSRAASTIHGLNTPVQDGVNRGYSTEIEAVLAATNIYNPISIKDDREYIGAVLERNGYYYYTVGAGNKGENSIVVRARIPKSYSVVAFWHTHGAPAHERTYFSDADMDLVRSYNKPFYLADYTGGLKVLIPGDPSLPIPVAANLGLPRREGFSRGNPVRARDGEVLTVCTAQDA